MTTIKVGDNNKAATAEDEKTNTAKGDVVAVRDKDKEATVETTKMTATAVRIPAPATAVEEPMAVSLCDISSIPQSS